MNEYDVAVIGSGPGGYVAAIRCSQLGLKTCIIEKYTTLGGTCLNVGCIPSKTLLDSSHHYYNAVKNFNTHGIDLDRVTINLPQMIRRKDKVVEQTTQGINYLMNKNKITVYKGLGSFKTKNNLNITKEDGSIEEIKAENIIIATGSKPSTLPFINIDKNRVISSTEALKLKEIPKHLIVIGGGVVGLELGSVYKRLGSDVSVIEFMPDIIPNMDKMLSKELQKSLKKQGMTFYLGHRVKSVKNDKDLVLVTAENSKGESIELKGDYVLVSVGRRPYTQGLSLENVGVSVNQRGQIDTNDNLQTNIPNIYAIGDVVKGVMLAHKAQDEGVLVAEYIAGQKPHINYNLIPSVVYTWPEVACVGKTEEQLKKEDINYKVGSFPMRALGRSRASMDLDGQVKVLAQVETDQILGVHIIGARAADIIGEAVVAMEFVASAEDLSRISHAHPTFTEALKEACLAATQDRALHV